MRTYLIVLRDKVLFSFACFRLLQFSVRWYLFGKCTFRTFSYFGWSQSVAANDVEGDIDNRNSQSLTIVPPNKKWRISNEAVSLIHSCVSGVWASYACLAYPKLLEDMVYYRNSFSLHLVFLSAGYLLHDLVDLLVNERSLRILELLFHHIIVLFAFAISLITNKFLGVVIYGLLMELNSIFLHSRSLLNLYGVPKMSTSFRIIALLNVVSFMIFRIFISSYLLYWQLTTVFWMGWTYGVITFIIIASLGVTNLVLLYRVLAADGLLGKKRQRRVPIKTDAPSQIIITSASSTEDHFIQN
ncbi:unnamed protein product [Dracunculus medinensis]|uniref:TLC domain-containing protein n=1 Tax=Dracunculus medinensis TaxID=318479 RepID=A0A0N4U8K8_DRAME|nr:unnamed protein product [Dracunculus medinensis]